MMACRGKDVKSSVCLKWRSKTITISFSTSISAIPFIVLFILPSFVSLTPSPFYPAVTRSIISPFLSNPVLNFLFFFRYVSFVCLPLSQFLSVSLSVSLVFFCLSLVSLSFSYLLSQCTGSFCSYSLPFPYSSPSLHLSLCLSVLTPFLSLTLLRPFFSLYVFLFLLPSLA